MSNGTIRTKNELEFAIFCVENLARRLNADPQKVYDALAVKSDLLQSYIVAEYEMLHTQDKDYILDDILYVMEQKGVTL